jgi:hypothetical protein
MILSSVAQVVLHHSQCPVGSSIGLPAGSSQIGRPGTATGNDGRCGHVWLGYAAIGAIDVLAARADGRHIIIAHS